MASTSSFWSARILPVIAVCLAIPLRAEPPQVNTVPISGDDLREVLSMNLQKQEVSFGAPKFVTMRIRSEGQNHDFPLRTAATPKVTLMVYCLPHERHLQYWVSTGDQYTLSAFLYFAEKQADFTRSGVMGGVYTVQGGDSEENAEKHPSWKLEILTSDQPPPPEENAPAGHP